MNIYLTSQPLSSVAYCFYLDHYIFRDPVSGVNIFYPLTAFGGDFNDGNLLEAPENFDSSYWFKNGTRVLNDTSLTPYAYVELPVADRVQDIGTGTHSLCQLTDAFILSTGQDYTFSCYASGNSRNFFGLYITGSGTSRVGATYNLFTRATQTTGSSGLNYTVLGSTVSAIGEWSLYNMAFRVGANTPHTVHLVHRDTAWAGSTSDMMEVYNSNVGTSANFSLFWGAQIRKGNFSASNNTYPAIQRPSYLTSISGGPFNDVCFQDYCYKSIQYDPIKLYCVSTVNYILSGIDENDANVIEVVYDFGDGSPIAEYSYKRENESNISPIQAPVSHTYYPDNTTARTFTPSISVIRSDCCINSYYFTLCTFKCSILDIYEDVILHNAQQSTDFNVVLTLEKKNSRQLFKNALDLSNIVFAVPLLSSLPNLVEPVPPAFNRPKPEPLAPPDVTEPINNNPVVPPERAYYYKEGRGVDLAPDFLRIVPSEDIDSAESSGLTLSGDGPPYLPSEGIDIQIT